MLRLPTLNVVGSLAAVFLGCASVPEGVTVWVESPTSVSLGERFTIKTHIRNASQQSVRLRSLDIGDSYLEGVEIDASEPRFSSLDHLPIDNTMSYGFDIDIAAGHHAVVNLHAEAKEVGIYQGDFDICVNSEINCYFQTITTPITAAGALNHQKSLGTRGEPMVVVAPDGRSEIVVPADWAALPRPEGGPQLFVQSEDRNANVTIGSFDKDSEVSLEQYAAGLHDLIEAKYSPIVKLGPPRHTSSSSLQRIGFAFASKRTNKAYLHMAIEGRRYMHQVLCEMSLETSEKKLPQIEELVESFRER